MKNNSKHISIKWPSVEDEKLNKLHNINIPLPSIKKILYIIFLLILINKNFYF